MIRFRIAALQLAELLVSSMVHLVYGFYIFSTAVAMDISQALNECFKPNVNVNTEIDMNLNSQASTNLDDLPPIVLIHGIFGFGKGRLGGCLILREQRRRMTSIATEAPIFSGWTSGHLQGKKVIIFGASYKFISLINSNHKAPSSTKTQ
ncbi:hypothetical protein NE237_031176 [Protea cynaroides]|uniref:Uncharacterized protein n=1 Tax=Protea cynaroides TaxID=273540 RepID=A0A9Q0R277_9MAGN|nr:hypothetical protein NE237_031176 [Protea cynaroides]